ncbi:hypothetical protein Mal15_02480 [Stieleria maiorica]|uniref:Uncharacterized protein n=1 Tax=Stieleria maiorica TaxID=2795974 RepID=A0A5B9M542_9BACT|nr:hypothetical protein [Stieleria maiorica]QEF96221.1 hypothetical protein Mal15_02480 [Stieleria maiorica]
MHHRQGLGRINLAVLATVLVSCAGCRVLSPTPIKVDKQYVAPALLSDNGPQVEIGRPNKLLDGVGNVIGIPSKLLLWDRRVDRHKISEDTLITLTQYLEYNNLAHVKVRANQYDPLDEWRRLRKNTSVAAPIRYTLGTLAVAGDALLPGRLFGGDHFNPYTQTIHLYSDVPAIALHEAGHAKDFTRREYQGLYSIAYAFVPIWHETLATEDAFSYLQTIGDPGQIAEANRILYPAYGTYVGDTIGNFAPGAALPIYLGSVALGHVNGRMLNRLNDQQLAAKPEDSDPAVTVALVSSE